MSGSRLVRDVPGMWASKKLGFGCGQTGLEIGNSLLGSDVWSTNGDPLLNNAGDLLGSTFASITPVEDLALGAAKGQGGPVQVNVPLFKFTMQVGEEDTSR